MHVCVCVLACLCVHVQCMCLCVYVHGQISGSHDCLSVIDCWLICSCVLKVGLVVCRVTDAEAGWRTKDPQRDCQHYLGPSSLLQCSGQGVCVRACARVCVCALYIFQLVAAVFINFRGWLLDKSYSDGASFYDRVTVD